MTAKITAHHNLVLIEGPEWGNAKFYGEWLLEAAKANELLQHAKSNDAEFCKGIDTLECMECLDFGITATVFLSKFVDKEFQTFVVAVDSADLTHFVLMAEMGFFTLAGDRYQMTLPTRLDRDVVKKAHLKLAETEDEDWIHPERLVVAMPRSQAEKYQRLLHNVSQAQRLADRRALLFLD